MQNLAALRAAVFLRSAKNHRGGGGKTTPPAVRVLMVQVESEPDERPTRTSQFKAVLGTSLEVYCKNKTIETRVNISHETNERKNCSFHQTCKRFGVDS